MNYVHGTRYASYLAKKESNNKFIDSRRYPMKRFSVLFLFLVLAIPIGAHADVLFDNIVITQSGQNSQWNNGVMLGQSFTTGSSSYILTSVDLYMIDVNGVTGFLSIWTNESNRPGSLVGVFTSPATFSSVYAINTFTTSGISLNANSEYWVVLSKTPGNGYLSWVYSDSQTGDTGYGSSFSSTDWTSFAHAFEMRVNYMGLLDCLDPHVRIASVSYNAKLCLS